MKWWGYILIGLVLGIAGTLLWRGPVSDEVRDLQNRLAVAEEHSRQLAIVDSMRQVRIDSLESLVALVPRDSLARLTREAKSARDAARTSAQEAAQALATARTTSDSLSITTAALWASQRHAEASDSLAARLEIDLEATGRMLALTREVQVETAAQRDSARAEAGRWKTLAIDLMDGVTHIGQQPKFGRAVETVAIGTATVKACQNGLVTAGCVAGVVVTGKRLL